MNHFNKIYAYSTFIPYSKKLPKLPKDVFNIFSGFQCLISDEIDESKFTNILNHIKEVWCDNNLQYYNYIIK